MKIRDIEKKDICFIKEWLADDDIIKWFTFDSKKATKNVETFVKLSKNKTINANYAIVDDNDEYLGTVSLKNINNVDGNAEFAICLRKKAMGCGVSKFAMINILEIAFNDLKLNRVYLNVLFDNMRAIKSYEKFGWKFEGTFRNAIMHNGSLKDLLWFSIIKEEYYEK